MNSNHAPSGLTLAGVTAKLLPVPDQPPWKLHSRCSLRIPLTRESSIASSSEVRFPAELWDQCIVELIPATSLALMIGDTSASECRKGGYQRERGWWQGLKREQSINDDGAELVNFGKRWAKAEMMKMSPCSMPWQLRISSPRWDSSQTRRSG